MNCLDRLASFCCDERSRRALMLGGGDGGNAGVTTLLFTCSGVAGGSAVLVGQPALPSSEAGGVIAPSRAPENPSIVDIGVNIVNEQQINQNLRFLESLCLFLRLYNFLSFLDAGLLDYLRGWKKFPFSKQGDACGLSSSNA